MNTINIDTKQIVSKYGFKFTKSLGQNFLTDESVLMDIVNGAAVNEEDMVIEIGPGIGTLTKVLLSKAKMVNAVELDSKLIPILEQELKEYSNFKLIHEDALKIDYNQLIGDEKSVKIVANLPYYITTPIISHLLTGGYNFKSLTVMIQKEVAERIASKENCKAYGALSLLVQYYCDVEVIRKVPPTSFIPQPKVDSLVIRMDKLDTPKVQPKSIELFFRIIRESFNMRRKTLWNSLKGLKLSSDNMTEAFQVAGIDPVRRGETLSIFEFATLADCIYDILGEK
ncbi:MAG: 16S rRNA (adenine(1518)-N(6)/adenine(1519)-N(6))-dimethyltransferase RsmA [Clostridiaceae bacterium]|nr:16S rRNA (adenine(1518)-N(6)/adenine(1519)-N(6))-dimethyltransferase RsmA [Clostridiaceae bacterium]